MLAEFGGDARAAPMHLSWHAVPDNPEQEGSLYDEEIRTGHVRYLDLGPPRWDAPNRDHLWNWSVFAFVWPRPAIETGGRCLTKEEAKAAAEAAYRAICDIPGARDMHMTHNRQLERMRARAKARAQRA
ncbi:hypothetical protein EV668_3116 [Enterovirga rhinocerotis]|uniref:Uncharacterized protein n=1 Tax=Enterovirga rhinocerotis TaxID=1339210 RepID=A0A4R7BWL2_9HYPH|nr:hypothetical protein EV668_3116 [Enterovirga rhinocerotis]